MMAEYPTPCIIDALTHLAADLLTGYLEDGSQLTDHGHAAHPEVLADRDLEEEEGYSADKHGEEVRDKEGSCRMEIRVVMVVIGELLLP